MATNATKTPAQGMKTIWLVIMLVFIAYFLWRMYQDEKGAR